MNDVTIDLRHLLAVIDTADGGCSHCVGELYEKMGFVFPELKDQLIRLRPELESAVMDGVKEATRTERYSWESPGPREKYKWEFQEEAT